MHETDLHHRNMVCLSLLLDHHGGVWSFGNEKSNISLNSKIRNPSFLFQCTIQPMLPYFPFIMGIIGVIMALLRYQNKNLKCKFLTISAPGLAKIMAYKLKYRRNNISSKGQLVNCFFLWICKASINILGRLVLTWSG